ncbi:hypothetical protein C0583_04235 [Candidatus Parcubacteria bacterium]|nr:MAG: hypothetical protein C0583_04235 [Candidatus Parcubacteria bacterium]
MQSVSFFCREFCGYHPELKIKARELFSPGIAKRFEKILNNPDFKRKTKNILKQSRRIRKIKE